MCKDINITNIKSTKNLSNSNLPDRSNIPNKTPFHHPFPLPNLRKRAPIQKQQHPKSPKPHSRSLILPNPSLQSPPLPHPRRKRSNIGQYLHRRILSTLVPTSSQL